MKKTQDIKKLMEAVDILKAISNPKRLSVLCYLLEGELSVGELSDLVGLSQSALSQHLAKLRNRGLVGTRRMSQTIYYSLKSPEVKAIISTLKGIYCRNKKSRKC